MAACIEINWDGTALVILPFSQSQVSGFVRSTSF